MLKNKKIVLIEEIKKYPDFCFVGLPYPEFKNKSRNLDSNNFYDLLRKGLYEYGLDKTNFNKSTWNPFKKIIKPKDKIVLKPNWVLDNNIEGTIDSLITHPSYIKFLLDYIIISLKGEGEITICDAPLQSCDLSNLFKLQKIDVLLNLYKQKYPKIKFSVFDLRKTTFKKEHFDIYQKKKIGDPNGYYLIDLEEKSFLEEITKEITDFRVTNYNPDLMKMHHHIGKHEYLISKTILDADVIFNIPKFKTHIKAGLTGALKNFIGMNGHKEYLPHHRFGSSKENGDQYINNNFFKEKYSYLVDYFYRNYEKLSKIERKGIVFVLSSLFVMGKITSKDKTLDGGWSGNDTIWRTILDLNNILYFYNTKTNKLDKIQKRKVFTIVDGVICGEDHGPLRPKDKFCGISIIGGNPIIIDALIGQIIGYNLNKIKQIYSGYYDNRSLLIINKKKLCDENIIIVKNNCVFNKKLKNIKNKNFIVPKYWIDAKK